MKWQTVKLMALNFLNVHILISEPGCGGEGEAKIRVIIWGEPHTPCREILQCPCSDLWDYRTVIAISHLQVPSWLHCSQKHFLPQQNPVVHCSEDIIPSDIVQDRLYVRRDFQFGQAYWDFYCSGSWRRGLWCSLFILCLAYFFLPNKIHFCNII